MEIFSDISKTVYFVLCFLASCLFPYSNLMTDIFALMRLIIAFTIVSHYWPGLHVIMCMVNLLQYA